MKFGVFPWQPPGSEGRWCVVSARSTPNWDPKPHSPPLVDAQPEAKIISLRM